MNESNEEFRESGRDILEYLSSLRLLSSDLDVSITTAACSGNIMVRGGRIVAAQTGDISGNGALFSLVTQGVAEISAVKSTEPVSADVTVTYEQMAHICKKVPPVNLQKDGVDESQRLQEAVHLFLQFRRKEAGARLVEILKDNRFYYPAWLWHSRLINRGEYLIKAIGEMKKWGGHDPLICKEINKISPQLQGRTGAVKRCIFCWSIVESGQECCHTCNCLLAISATKSANQGDYGELKASLAQYEEEFLLHPENSRIAYCLCLGKFSLGKLDAARQYLEKALQISPQEQLFIKTGKFLENLQRQQKKNTIVPKKVEKTLVKTPAAVAAGSGAEKTILVVEDSNTARKVISMVLSRQGYGIEEATTGGEGLGRLAELVPDLVLLDVMLPDMDGYRVLGKIRSDSRLKDVPVVMLTGKKKSTDRMKGLATGANEYLTKPFDPAKLVKVLERFVGGDVKKAEAAPVKKMVAGKVPAKATRVAPPSPRPVVKPVVEVPRPVATTIVAGPHILVVEDSPTTRKVISMVLKRKGYPLKEATTGEEALMAIEAQPPSLILLDAMLPDMTGYSILLQLQKDSGLKKIPVVMLTAKTGATDRQKGMRAGAVAYLTKPFDPNKLTSTVSQHLPAEFSAKN